MHFDEPVSHEIFMERALYDPSDGYYATRALVGEKGDFSTSATLSGSFAEAVANWIKSTAVRLGLDSPYPIIELGPGDGSLAKAISERVADSQLHLVETSRHLRAIQKERLSGIRVEHHDDLQGALRSTGGLGLVVANEFIDAFPAAKLRWQEDDWYEVGVVYEDGNPREILAPLARDIDADAPATPKDGETIYVHPAFKTWLAHNTQSIKSAAILFIDYGAERPSRECRAYEGQERYEDLGVYETPGKRDITCDVNFVDLERWCHEFQLQTSPVISQAEFLKSNLDDFESRQKNDEAFAFLTHPLGAGGAFKVLIAQHTS